MRGGRQVLRQVGGVERGGGLQKNAGGKIQLSELDFVYLTKSRTCLTGMVG